MKVNVVLQWLLFLSCIQFSTIYGFEGSSTLRYQDFNSSKSSIHGKFHVRRAGVNFSETIGLYDRRRRSSGGKDDEEIFHYSRKAWGGGKGKGPFGGGNEDRHPRDHKKKNAAASLSGMPASLVISTAAALIILLPYSSFYLPSMHP